MCLFVRHTSLSDRASWQQAASKPGSVDTVPLEWGEDMPQSQISHPCYLLVVLLTSYLAHPAIKTLQNPAAQSRVVQRLCTHSSLGTFLGGFFSSLPPVELPSGVHPERYKSPQQAGVERQLLFLSPKWQPTVELDLVGSQRNLYPLPKD